MEASGGLPGVCSALMEHTSAKWLESRGGNEKRVTTQPEHGRLLILQNEHGSKVKVIEG